MEPKTVEKVNLAQLVPNAVGLLVFDENCNIIEASGIGKDRLGDIIQINQVELDKEGFGLLTSQNTQVVIYRQDGNTVAVYTH